MPKNLKNLKVALLAEELTQLGGAERVLDVFIELFPKAPIYTLVWNKEKTQHRYDKCEIRTSFIQKLPFGKMKYKWYLPWMIKAVESFDFSDYNLVLSVTSALTKGIIINPPTIHICYYNTPTRWLWKDRDSYLKTAPIPFIIKPIMPFVIKKMQKWDLAAANRPTFMISNSENIRKKVLEYYHRQTTSLFPPVDTSKFKVLNNPGKYYLVVSRLEPYKKVDLVIEAFKKLNLPLKIVGSGTKKEQLAQNLPKNIELIGRVSDEALPKYYEEAIAFIMPQDEDAGITQLEAMAAGRPVIAIKRGGALDSIIDHKTGILFEPQTIEGLIKAVKKFQTMKFDAKFIRAHAEKFDKELFKKKILDYIIDKIKDQKSNLKMR